MTCAAVRAVHLVSGLSSSLFPCMRKYCWDIVCYVAKHRISVFWLAPRFFRFSVAVKWSKSCHRLTTHKAHGSLSALHSQSPRPEELPACGLPAICISRVFFLSVSLAALPVLSVLSLSVVDRHLALAFPCSWENNCLLLRGIADVAPYPVPRGPGPSPSVLMRMLPQPTGSCSLRTAFPFARLQMLSFLALPGSFF